MTSSPFVMVFAIFLNLTVVCLQRGNTYALCNTIRSRKTTQGNQTLVKSLIIILLGRQKQIKRFYSNLLSHFSLPSLPITFMKLRRLLSKHHHYQMLNLLFRNGKEYCNETKTDNFGVKCKPTLQTR